MYVLAILTVSGTDTKHFSIINEDDLERKSATLLRLAQEGMLKNKHFNNALTESASQNVDLLVLSDKYETEDAAKEAVIKCINELVKDPSYRPGEVTNAGNWINSIDYAEYKDVAEYATFILKHSEDPGFIVWVTKDVKQFFNNKDITYKLLADRLPRFERMLKRFGPDDLYHQVIVSGSKETCQKKANEMLTRYVDDIRCLNF